MLKIKEAIVVEGLHDKIKLEQLVDTTIIATDGFRIYKNKEKQLFLKRLAQTHGIIILTDSDTAGQRIRGYIKKISGDTPLKHAYIPQVIGKERRKDKASAEGLLGVEGINNETILRIITSVATKINASNQKSITKLDLYTANLSGSANSKKLRADFAKYISLPPNISTNALLDALNSLYSHSEFEEILTKFLSQRNKLSNT